MSAGSWSGGCQCGAVRYRVDGPLGDSGACFCRMCQKASGNAVLPLVNVPAGKLVWTRGTPAEFASTPVTVRGFCRDCGTPLYLFEDGFDDYELTVGSLDDPDAAPPTHTVGTESKPAWFDGLGGLPSKTTEDDRTPEELAKFTSNQHPDHDTDQWPA